MTEFAPRLFDSDEAVRHLGEGLLACSLRREEWTHEAHLAATLYLMTARPDIDVDARIGDLIRAFNESVGGVNDDHNGYHDTITHCFVAGVRRFLTEWQGGEGLAERVNALLVSPMGHRDWPLRFYSRELLFSVAARRGLVASDIVAPPGTSFSG
ncbi:hypothetical protein [Stakelama tenebrarum]|uniref:Uncharacterized protein n=1 Tax=Stakelama tenebrarum TaxID=2711215 RepID=A0A6G6Y6Z5_9SPHN|nr:hypothetical protein [Sphingosinithalassobacter tenebrarum]QIG80567.1 hypothetical protein G5C33_12785 [Sphingosinithalassobacter tenebrarum]